MREKTRGVRRLWEDKFLVALEKPAGLPTTTSFTSKETTLEDWVRKNIKTEDLLERGGILHRLDKETSGVVLVAKDRKSFASLKEQFKKRKIDKKYLFLAEGRLPKEGEVFAPIAKNPNKFASFRVFIDGKKARTFFRVDSFWKVGERIFSFGEAHPVTGRTHQIRVHLSYLGHPIVGDKTYGSSLDILPLKRMFLHAFEITFFHPITHRCVKVTSELPSDLRKVLRWLRKKGKKL